MAAQLLTSGVNRDIRAESSAARSRFGFPLDCSTYSETSAPVEESWIATPAVPVTPWPSAIAGISKNAEATFASTLGLTQPPETPTSEVFAVWGWSGLTTMEKAPAGAAALKPSARAPARLRDLMRVRMTISLSRHGNLQSVYAGAW